MIGHPDFNPADDVSSAVELSSVLRLTATHR